MGRFFELICVSVEDEDILVTTILPKTTTDQDLPVVEITDEGRVSPPELRWSHKLPARVFLAANR